MKKIVLLFTALLIGLTTVAAETKSASKGEDLVSKRSYFTQPISFIERGVEFLIFPDGSFDFNTHVNFSNNLFKKQNIKRRGFNTVRSNHLYNNNFSSINSSLMVNHDRSGKVRRIGNVFLNYNHIGQIKRIGSVYTSYNRKGLINQIGNMRLLYNKHGHVIKTIGQVNSYSSFNSYSNNNFNNITNSTLYYKERTSKNIPMSNRR